jgi:hypothetical protein
MFKLSTAAAARSTVALPRPAAVRDAIGAPARFQPPASFRAELRAKRLGGSSVRDDRYTATLPVSGSTPYELISALAEAVSGIEELLTNKPGEERVVLEISLTSQAA